MAQAEPVFVREATEADIAGIRDAFEAAYGDSYPYPVFLEESWLKRSVYNDDILMLVAIDPATKRVAGTASVVFEVGAHSDLLGEFGRLVVHPDFRGKRVGNVLMQKRIEYIENRLHVGIVENRCTHPYSQLISHRYGFAPVGFLPMKHQFANRESHALFVRHFGPALSLRANHPRIVPEAYPLAHLALNNCDLRCDAIVDEESASYPPRDDLVVEELTTQGLPSLLRIERGRVRNREIFGPMRLHYGFFQLTARKATYLLARLRTTTGERGPIAGAIGFIRDKMDRCVKVFELIARADNAIRFLFEQLVKRCENDWETVYVEADVSAHAPRMQRTLLELGFLPVAFVPAMVFHDVERFDVIKFARLSVPIELEENDLTDGSQEMADRVVRLFEQQSVLPRVAEAIHRMTVFDGLNDEQTTRVAGACTVEEFEAGEHLFRPGGPPECIHLILRGSVAIKMGDPPQRIGVVETGEPVGEIALLTNKPHTANAVAQERVVAAVLAQEDLGDLTRQRPDISVVLFRNIAVSLGRKLHRMDDSVARDENRSRTG